MATAFKSLDPVPFYPKAQPSIRVAFSAGDAVLAARAKSAITPVADSTLEELVDSVCEARLPLRVLLAERNELVTRLNAADAATGEASLAAICTGIQRLEETILGRPATNPDDAVARLVALAQVSAEGHEVDDKEAAAVIRDAQRHFGIGYLHHQFAPAAAMEVAAAPTEDWSGFYQRYAQARGARLYYQTVILKPLADRHSAVRAAWPADHHCGEDPIASVALAAVDYDPEQERYDEFVMLEHNALVELIMCPAPLNSDLATKLSLFHAEEMWTAPDASDMIESLVADARRIAGLGRLSETDARIHEAFAKRRGEAAYWASSDRPAATDEIEERSNAIVSEAEETIFGTRAQTIEGVVAKLRTLFPHLSQQPYSEDALTKPTGSAFAAGLRADCGNDQVLWGCIEDLTRIAGISLAEQGA